MRGDSSSRCNSLAFAVALLFTAGTAFAQDAPQNSASAQQNSSAPSNQDGRPNQAANYLTASRRVSAPPARFPPPLAIPKDSVLTVRIDQALSSDYNRIGDAFSATLTQPIVVHGIVVSRSGQTVLGRVVEAKKAGMVSGVSRLGIQLTSLTIADGQNAPLESQLLVRESPTSRGRDASAIVGTTALGAAIGAAADWGTGAAIGAGVGAMASTVGVLLTRGYPTVVYPETLLAFQLAVPVPVNTDYAPEAFHAVTAADYPQTQPRQLAPPPEAGRATPGYGYPAPSPYYVDALPYSPYPYPYYSYYGYYGYPYYWSPGFSFFFGPSYYGHYYGHYHGGGYHGRHH